MKKIVIGNDHGGYDLKKVIKKHLKKKGYEIVDVGTYSRESVDYPDFAEKAAKMVSSKEVDYGILICKTGIGMSISANKIRDVRAANVHNIFTARSSKEHNDANIITLGSEVVKPDDALEIIEVWLNARFEGGRHKRRIEKISKLELEKNKRSCHSERSDSD